MAAAQLQLAGDEATLFFERVSRDLDKHLLDGDELLQLQSARTSQRSPDQTKQLAAHRAAEQQHRKLLLSYQALSVDGVLRSSTGSKAISIALQVEAKVLTLQQVMQDFVDVTWMGPMHIRVSDLDYLGGSGSCAAACRTLSHICLNVLIGPLVLCFNALCPFEEGGLKQCGLADDGWIKSWYVLNAPIAKFTLAFVCELALALIFTLVPIDELARDDLCPLLLAWLGSAFAWELRQALTSGLHEYLSDRFNRLDLPAIGFALSALLHAMVNGTDNISLTRYLSALGVVFLWLRLQRVLLVFARFGPYALMVFVMMEDVLTFIAVLVVVPFAFAAAAFNLYKPIGSSSGAALEDHAADDSGRLLASRSDAGGSSVIGLGDCTSYFETFPNALAFLVEHALNGDAFFDCARTSKYPVATWALSAAYISLAGLLLLNMLIAMMAKSFDNVSEAQVMNYSFLFTQTVIEIDRGPPAPPPLYLLSLPCELYSLVRHLVVHKLLGKVPNVDQTGRDEFFEEMSMSAIINGGDYNPHVSSRKARALKFGPSHLSPWRLSRGRKSLVNVEKAVAAAKQVAARAAASVSAATHIAADVSGLVEGNEEHCKPPSLSQHEIAISPVEILPMDEDLLEPSEAAATPIKTAEPQRGGQAKLQFGGIDHAAFITEYIVGRQDDVAEEGRWRTTMKRSITDKFGKMNARVDTLEAKIDEVLRAVASASPALRPRKASLSTVAPRRTSACGCCACPDLRSVPE